MDYREEIEVEHGRQFQQVGGLDPRATPFGEEQGDHDGILFADLAGQFRKNAGRHAEVDADVEDMADAHPAAGDDQNPVLFRQVTDLFHERQDHLAAVVDDPMAADLDNMEVGNESERGDPCLPAHQTLADEGFSPHVCFDFVPWRHCVTLRNSVCITRITIPEDTCKSRSLAWILWNMGNNTSG